MQQPSKHRMLEHCLRIRAQRNVEQCPTNAPNVLTWIFGLLEHLSHVSNARRGAERFPPIEKRSHESGSATRALRLSQNLASGGEFNA